VDDYNYVSLPTGTVSGIEYLSIAETPMLTKKDNQVKKMEQTIVSQPYVFGTSVGDFNVIFEYRPQTDVYVSMNSDKMVARDMTLAHLYNHPFNPNSPLFVNAHGLAIRRPKERNSKFSGRLYALVNALNNSGFSANAKRAVIKGYLESLGVKPEVCNFIVDTLRLQ